MFIVQYLKYEIQNTYLKYLIYQNTNTFLQVYEIPKTKCYFQNTENTKYWDPIIFLFLFCESMLD